MRITKLDHAALIIQEGGRSLIIDPGSFLTAPIDVHDAAAVVITHEHPDHIDPSHLATIVTNNPGVPVFAPAGAAAAIGDGFDVTVVAPGDETVAGPFSLRFFGGRHAVIHESIPVIDNVGVLVNDEFYYPGDSYAVPEGVIVKTLAAPVGAPWLKIGEAMDFVLAVAPEHTFATHDMTLSRPGLDMGRARLAWATEQGGGTFHPLDPGETIDL